MKAKSWVLIHNLFYRKFAVVVRNSVGKLQLRAQPTFFSFLTHHNVTGQQHFASARKNVEMLIYVTEKCKFGLLALKTVKIAYAMSRRDQKKLMHGLHTVIHHSATAVNYR